MNEISQVPSHLLAAPEEKKPKGPMGKDEFMSLLMTQLKYQDPIKPMDHHEFASQLAQFSQLEQLTHIGSGIQNLRTGQGDEAKLQALSMIGKRVQAAGNEIHLVAGQPVSMNPSVKEGVKLSTATIYDESGKIVRDLDLSRLNGEAIQWDGKNKDGLELPSGRYTFRVHGVGKDGQSQEVGTELSGRVTGVDFDGSTPILILETGTSGTSRLEIGKVRQVNIGETKDKAAENPAQIEAAPKPIVPQAKSEPAPEPAEAPSDSGGISIDFGDFMAGRGGNL